MCNCNKAAEDSTNGQKASVDLTKPVQTRDGRPVRILCTDKKGSDYPIIALVENSPGREVTASFTMGGKLNMNDLGPSHNDLVNVPAKVVSAKWLNVYPGHFGSGHTTLQAAKREASSGYLGQLKLTTYSDGSFTVEKAEGV